MFNKVFATLKHTRRFKFIFFIKKFKVSGYRIVTKIVLFRYNMQNTSVNLIYPGLY